MQDGFAPRTTARVLARGLLALVCALALLSVASGVDARRNVNRAAVRERQAAAARAFAGPRTRTTASTGVKHITFHNPKASEFYVDGTKIPEVDWDVGPSYSGLLPISNKTGETRKLFFWFFPPGPQGSTDDLIFWTNGGPGCSSLEGLLQENGPISWKFGPAKPTQNQWSWTNLSSILYVEQPIGTGFTQGVPNIQDENDLAEQVVGFLGQFLNVFEELKGNKLYLTGESYAGEYLPYIANYIYDTPSALALDLQGIWLGDPYIGWDVIQSEVGVLDFVRTHPSVFGFSAAFLAKLAAMAMKCGYATYAAKHVTYPPKGPLPLPGSDVEFDDGCDVWSMVEAQATLNNPAFNIYRVYDVYPILWDVLGYPGTNAQIQVGPVYFDRPDVKAAIHAPTNVSWSECASPDLNLFATPDGSDPSPPTSLGELPRAIERSVRTVIMHGQADFLLQASGTRAVIQNMTWAGKQGFQTAPAADSFVVDGIGSLGTAHAERGLALYEVALSGHMVPQFAPWSAYQGMEYLMGRRSKL